MERKTLHTLKFFFILTALLLVFAVNVSNSFAEFYVIAGSRGAGTEIKALPYTISSSGFYYVTKDLTCQSKIEHGITITADNVTLDLMGFSLIGPGGKGTYDGIYMNGQSNVEIRNGTVRNFRRHGIHEFNTAGTSHRTINIRARGNGYRGISLLGKGNLVERCAAVGNGYYGIYTGIGSTVTGNICYDNVNNGIHTNNGSTITGNTCYSNSGRGISAASGSTVTNNTCYDNDYGIYLSGVNLVDQNTCSSNSTNMNSYSSCVYGDNCAPE